VNVGLPYGALPKPDHPVSLGYYIFLGWYTEKTGSTEVTSSTKVTITKNHTLYAHWGPYIPKKVTVTFDPQGGTVSPASKKVTVGLPYGELPVPVPTKTGFIFIGWFTEKAGSGEFVTEDTIVTIDHDHTLYAYWMRRPITVTFDPQGGTVSPNTKKVPVDSVYRTLPTPSPPSIIKKFIGWFTEKVGGNKVTEDTIVTIDHDHTLYAHWKNLL